MANKIQLFGTVVPDQYIWPEDTGFFSSKMVIDALADMSGAVDVFVNSDGGVPSEGEAIRAAFEAYPGEVTIKITGNAHSAASLMVMSADQIEMSAGSLMLIHDPSMSAYGNPAALTAAADELGVMADAYASVYAAKADITTDEARAIMQAETMLGAQAAVEAGFADAVSALGGKSADVDMSRASALAAVSAAMVRAHLAQMKFEGAQGDLESGESQTPGQVAIETDGVKMSKKTLNTPAADDVAAAAVATPVMQAAAAGTAPVMQADAVAAERLRCKTIRAAAAPFMAHLGQAGLDALIDDGKSVAEANAVIMAAAAAAQPKTSRVEILRDERDTARVGMTAALAAQLMGVDPTDDRANAYMSKSIVDMATDLTGASAPRSVGAKSDVLMQASHTTADFPLILDAAFNTVIETAYELIDPTFDTFSREMTFNDFRAHDIVRPDNFPTLKKIGEDGEIKFGTFGEAKETLAIASYATGINVSRQLIVNDQMGAIADVLNNAAGIVPEFEEETFWAMLLSNPKLRGGVVLFHATHGNLGAAGAITTTNVSEGRKALRSHKSKDGRAIKSNAPAILIVGPERETEAEQFLAPVLAAEQIHVNPLARSLRLVVSEEITDGTWFLAVDKSKKTHSFKHGYLDGYRAPRVRVKDAFGQQGTALTIEHDFACGVVGTFGAYRRG